MSTKRWIYLTLALVLVVGLFAVPTGSVRADLAGAKTAFQAGGDRLVATQNTDGGWAWPLTGSSAVNTIGPIGKGLAQAYLHTGSAGQLAALQQVGTFLLAKTNNFSPSDGYLAAQLDAVFGGTTYRDYVTANYYAPLAVGTYNRNGAGTLYSTATYIDLIRTSRAGSQASLAAWDLGMGLVGAAVCGASTSEWIAGTEAEINELTDDDYDVIGLTGAIYGLAYVGASFDPSAGMYASSSSIADLAAILAGYQINNGGFTWDSKVVNLGEEDIQETAYAILALSQVNRPLYLTAIRNAADYIIGQRLSTGGWSYAPGVTEEYNEITGEALWGISVAYPELWVCPSGDCGHPGAAYNTIQAAIDAIPVGGMIYVFPGAYSETASGRTLYNSSGPYQFGLFFGQGKDNITLQGVDATGVPITDYHNVAATITTNATNSFGTSGVFVEANNITIQGLQIGANLPGDNKSVEVIGNGFAFRNNVINIAGGGSLYLNDWRYVADNSYVESYTISGNWFGHGASVDISSGAGVDGPASARVISGNSFTADGDDVYWASISFNGIVPSVGWFTDPVGGATITGNTFTGVKVPIRSRGTVEEADFNWNSYWTSNTFDKAVVAWDPATNMPRAYDYMSGGSLMNNTRRIGTSIQGEINNAVAGDTILVKPGTYPETLQMYNGYPVSVLINKANLTIKSTGGAASTIIDVPDGTLSTGVKVLANMGITTFDGFTVQGFTEGGIIQGMSAATGTTFHVLNNRVIPRANYLRNGIQVTGNGSSVVGNFVEGAHLTTDWASTAIGVVNASDVLVENNEVSGSVNGVDTGIAVYTWGAGMTANNVVVRNNTIYNANVALDVETYYASTVSNVTLEFNKVTNYTYPLNVFVNTGDYAGGTISNVDASPNWWGNLYGPTGEPIDPLAVIAPWCANAGCTTFYPPASGVIEIPAGTPGANVQLILDSAPDGSTIKFLGSPLANTGGYLINHPHTTILLANGTVISNNSPCFVVNADYVTITTESIGGAQCVPTSGSNGIDVTGPRVNLTVQGIDFVGATGTDGIHFAGAMTDLVIVDNWFHGFPGDGIEFTVQPAGVLDIHGNLFQANAGRGINASTFTVPAEYNSWGHATAPVVGVDITSGVDADPWTHVDLYMASSGTPWANQVVRGQTITYTVYANLVNANAADITLLYPANLTYVSQTLGGNFTNEILTTGTGSLHFVGYDQTGTETGSALPLFSATFTAASVGTAPMNLDETTDGFGMIASGSSSNIYAAALLDGSVTVIDLPTLTSTNLVGPYFESIPQEFQLTITNTNGGAYASPALNFTIPDGTLEYYNGSTWQTVTSPLALPAIAAGSTTNLSFRVTFTPAGSKAVSFTLRDTAAATDLASLAQNVTVYARPTLSTTDLVGYYLTGDAQLFHVTVTNPADGATLSGLSISFAGFPLDATLTGDFTLAGPLAPGASAVLTFTATFDTAGSYPITATLGASAYPQLALLPSTTAVVYTKPTITGNLAGPYLAGIPSTVNLTVTNPSGIPGPFNMVFDLPAGTLVNGVACPAGCTVPVTLSLASNPLSFTITFASAYTGPVGVSLYDTLPDPDRLLATLSQTGTAYDNLSVTGTISMQGRTFRGGVPVTLTAVLVPYGPYTATSINQISNNLSFSNVAEGDYVITTNQPRYLDLTVDLNKHKLFTTSILTINALELKGGDANDDNVIDSGDASVVGTQYGTVGTNGDVNFSGKVDVFDLALIGGNYTMTSASAYGAWLP